MSAMMWSAEASACWEPPVRPRLRLLPGWESDPVAGGRRPSGPAATPALADAAPSLAHARPVGVGAVGASASSAWELTQRGLALAVGGLAAVLAGAAGTLLWGFLQISDGPLP